MSNRAAAVRMACRTKKSHTEDEVDKIVMHMMTEKLMQHSKNYKMRDDVVALLRREGFEVTIEVDAPSVEKCYCGPTLKWCKAHPQTWTVVRVPDDRQT